jgi:putative SOS response-associated peptidase YedK
VTSHLSTAGLWERWEGREIINSSAILTTEANEVLRPVHDRMPMILHPEEYSLLMEGDAKGRESLVDLLRPYPAKKMVEYPVSPLVNNPRSKGPELIAERPLKPA